MDRTREAALVLRAGVCKVDIGEVDLAAACRSISLSADGHSPPRVELELLLPEITVDGEVTVLILPNVRDALLALGWTPPAGEGED